MSRQTFRANVLASEFPLVSNFYGRSIVVPQTDQFYIRPNVYSGEVADRNIGIPQILFAENVMPFSAGLQSIDYTTPVVGTAFSDFDQIFYLRDSSETRTLFSPANGKCYVYDQATAVWTAINKVVPSGSFCSVANLKGRTFVHFANNTNFYEWVGGALPNVVLTGLVATAINGLVSANSYLVAWNNDTVFWSSTITPTDFTPSLVTGAGSQKVLSVKGVIIYCKPINDGFVIYTSSGAVYARYSGNIRFPWVFSEVLSASGLARPEHACDDMDGSSIYVNTTDGLMSFDRLRATPIFPALSEFAAIGYIEQYNTITKTIDKITYNGKLTIKVAFIASRWFVFSYGVTSPLLTHAIIYDTSLKRWGKLRIDHVDCFEYFGDATDVTTVTAVSWAKLLGSWQAQANAWAAYGGVQSGAVLSNTVPYKSLGFLQSDGHVKVVDFAHTTITDFSILYTGRYQYIRAALMQLQDVDTEGLDQQDKTKLAVLTSYDGTNIDKVTYPMKVKAKGNANKWQMKLTGVNHTLRFEGNFQLNTIVIRSQQDGDR